ncbi:hypothetical protein GF327_03675 [Candidatus Woesearchaeota archaeon]|nr:hypothetical protein [Candidatus Woesearchaeota archaeon]
MKKKGIESVEQWMWIIAGLAIATLIIIGGYSIISQLVADKQLKETMDTFNNLKNRIQDLCYRNKKSQEIHYMKISDIVKEISVRNSTTMRTGNGTMLCIEIEDKNRECQQLKNCVYDLVPIRFQKQQNIFSTIQKALGSSRSAKIAVLITKGTFDKVFVTWTEVFSEDQIGSEVNKEIFSKTKQYVISYEYHKLINDIKEIIQEVSEIKTSSVNKNLDFPTEVEKMYFFNLSEELKELDYKENLNLHEKIKSYDESNLFFIQERGALKSYRIEGLDLQEPNYLCVKNIDGRMRLNFESTGNGVNILTRDSDSDCTYPVIAREVATYLEKESSEEFEQEMESLKESIENDFPEVSIDYELDYDPVEDKTKASIKFSSSLDAENFRLIHFIPKCMLQLADELSFSYEGKQPEEIEILREDPLIMWHFNEIDLEKTSINYEKSGKVDEFCEELLTNFLVSVRRRDGFFGKHKKPGIYKFDDSDFDEEKNYEDLYPDDLDNDGFPDEWEDMYGYNKRNKNDPGESSDHDSDGADSRAEYNHNMDPKNPDTDGDGILDGAEIQEEE